MPVRCSAVVTCSDCGTSLDGIPEDQSCPACGSARRTVHGAAVLSLGALSARAIGTVGFAQTPAWEQKWRDVLVGLADVEDLYALPDPTAETVRLAVEGFSLGAVSLPTGSNTAQALTMTNCTG